MFRMYLLRKWLNRLAKLFIFCSCSLKPASKKLLRFLVLFLNDDNAEKTAQMQQQQHIYKTFRNFKLLIYIFKKNNMMMPQFFFSYMECGREYCMRILYGSCVH